ncbi:MAG: hypothetical protein ACK4OG_04790, partial [Parvibaculum sp.]
IVRDSLGRPTSITHGGSAGVPSQTTTLRYDLTGSAYNQTGQPSASKGTLSEIVDAIQARRESHARQTGEPVPDREDTLFIAMLAASAAFGEAIIGRQLAESAGLDQDGLKRFRLWFARLVKDHLDSGK